MTNWFGFIRCVWSKFDIMDKYWADDVAENTCIVWMNSFVCNARRDYVYPFKSALCSMISSEITTAFVVGEHSRWGDFVSRTLDFFFLTFFKLSYPIERVWERERKRILVFGMWLDGRFVDNLFGMWADYPLFFMLLFNKSDGRTLQIGCVCNPNASCDARRPMEWLKQFWYDVCVSHNRWKMTGNKIVRWKWMDFLSASIFWLSVAGGRKRRSEVRSL